MPRTSKFTARDQYDMFKLSAQGMSYKAIGERYGVSHTTIQNQLTDLQREVAKEAPEVQQHMKKLESLLGGKIAMVLDQIIAEKALIACKNALNSGSGVGQLQACKTQLVILASYFSMPDNVSYRAY